MLKVAMTRLRMIIVIKMVSDNWMMIRMRSVIVIMVVVMVVILVVL